MTPFVSDPDFQLFVGDALEVLRGLPDESVHCCVTSPPYWGLRDYGTGSWEGGDPECDHLKVSDPVAAVATSTLDGGKKTTGHLQEGFGATCGKCGATRVDHQLGLEATPDEFVATMVVVFREVRRVLRSDGTCFVNLGDSYVSGQGGRQSAVGELPPTSRFDRPDPKPRPDLPNPPSGWAERAVTRRTYPGRDSGLKPKDLVGIPWAVAFALRADGWYLRSDIIWSKPNPMPESVTDRPTKAHEYVFLLTRSPRYFFDQEAVREQNSPNSHGSPRVNPGSKADAGGFTTNGQGATSLGYYTAETASGRNLRSVWEIATQPYPQAHFATFPEALPDRCIRAGTSERGCCPECGAPKRQEVVRTPLGSGPSVDPTPLTGRKGMNRERRPDEGTRLITKAEQRAYAQQLRESPHREAMEAEAGQAFAHYIRTDDSGARPLPPALLAAWLDRGWLTAVEASDCGCDAGAIPCTVLDPFMGSGTTALVARKLGRRSIGIELNPEYAVLAADRLKQLSLFAGDAA